MTELSILIPSRQEMFLGRTIQSILENIEADTGIIAVLDGAWADPPIPQNERVKVVYVPEAIGQRAAANLACKLSKAKYVMKVDAHCAFDKGFDRKMLEGFKAVGDNVTMVPVMNNLHAFDWNCRDCNWKKYQGPTPLKCERCGSTNLRKKMYWESRHGVHSSSYCFDPEPHFQYFEDYKHREPYLTDRKTGFTETMSLQGSCFMSTREKYWELDLGGEELGNWGNQGVQIACATWLSGGKVIVNHNTWYAHLFRTQGGDFSFPYEQSGKQIQRTKRNVRDLFWNFKHPKQIHPVSWLIEKFMPIHGWTQESLNELKASEGLLKT
jgi:hypothetical protein